MKIKFNNKSDQKLIRVKIVAKNNSKITISGNELNPTVAINNSNLTMCLAPTSLENLYLDGSWLLDGTQSINGIKN